MDNESVWLGSLRGPVRMAMIAASAALLLAVAYMIFGLIFGFSDITMMQMLRPEGRVLPPLTLVLLGITVLLVAIYLSDTRGHIEPERTGPLDILSLVLSRIAMIGVVMTVVVMFYEVIARYLFLSPTLWANELSLWIAGFVFMLGGLYAMQQRSHIRIYIIYDIMPRWMQKTADVLSVVFIWVFMVSLVWGGWNEARDKILRLETFGTAWDPPLPSTLKLGILVIITLVAIQALSNLIYDWHKDPESHSPMDEIDETEIANIRSTLGEETRNG